MQFQVPQNMTMEDHIIGSLTAIQFAIVVLGGLGAFLVFTSTSIPSPLNQAAGITLAMVTIVLAIGKFNDQPIYKFFRFFIAYLRTPKVRVWHKRGGAEVPLVRPNPSGTGQQVAHTVKKVSHQDIARLAAVLDSRGSVGAAPKIDIKTEMRTVQPEDKK